MSPGVQLRRSTRLQECDIENPFGEHSDLESSDYVIKIEIEIKEEALEEQESELIKSKSDPIDAIASVENIIDIILSKISY